MTTEGHLRALDCSTLDWRRHGVFELSQSTPNTNLLTVLLCSLHRFLKVFADRILLIIVKRITLFWMVFSYFFIPWMNGQHYSLCNVLTQTLVWGGYRDHGANLGLLIWHSQCLTVLSSDVGIWSPREKTWCRTSIVILLLFIYSLGFSLLLTLSIFVEISPGQYSYFWINI